MELENFEKYHAGKKPQHTEQLAWPLYGTGLDKLGKNGKPVTRTIPTYAEDELLMRIDAVSLCYTDVKEIDAGQTHPRLTYRTLEKDPIVPGHEISFTVVGVGDDLKDEYKVGGRYTLQPDVWVDGKSVPFCFGMDGGYRQYARIGKEILHGDAGSYLIPVPEDMPYASSAITEPWACVEAAYRIVYRNSLKAGGRTLILGGETARAGYTLDAAWLSENKPGEMVFSNVPQDLKSALKSVCEKEQVSFTEVEPSVLLGSEQKFDDIITLDATSEIVDQAARMLANHGVLAMMADKPLSDSIEIDAGRLHYDSIYFVGSSKLAVADAYTQTEPRSSLKSKGKTWILGAGGPMGRLHLQRAIESQDGPSVIVASEVTESRYEALIDFFIPFAKKFKKELLIINSVKDKAEYEKVMNRIMAEGGFDDIQVMVAIPAVIEGALDYAGRGTVVNLFAGLKRGVMAKVNAWLISGPQQLRLIGHSGSALDDQIAVVDRVISGQLKPELSVAAVGGMNQVADGIQAMKDWVYPGKIVIYPHVLDFPLTAIADLEKKIPEIAAYLGEGKTWSQEAEKVFLDRMLSNE